MRPRGSVQSSSTSAQQWSRSVQRSKVARTGSRLGTWWTARWHLRWTGRAGQTQAQRTSPSTRTRPKETTMQLRRNCRSNGGSTWSSNKRKVMELAYTRLAELCLKSEFQHVGDIVKGLEERLGYDAAHTVLDVLHQAHVISGCDYTSFVAAKKKKTFWNVLTAMARHSRLRSVLITGLGKLSAEDATVGVGLERHVATDVMDAVETFWACLHLPTAALEKVGKSAEDVPLPQLHTARTVADPNFLDGEAFPLSRVELEEHALRSAYVLTQFRVGTNTPRTALTHSSAVGWGFHIDEDGYRRRRRGRLLGRRRCTTDARNDRWPSGGGCSSVQPPN
mmetsp:Transcript_22395/g.58402  ORF Transcript_22395/g.58402 Transcript_22395/m.58402 type:complete len:336 (-) Transcript_22395:281-1288(-)